MPTAGTTLYVNALDDGEPERFKQELVALLPVGPDGVIRLASGSWVVRGTVAG